MVVDYTDDDPRVTLSLRQADILHALAHDDKLCDKGGCVPDLQAVDKSRYGECSRFIPFETKYFQHSPHIPPRIWSFHAGSNPRKTVGDWVQRFT